MQIALDIGTIDIQNKEVAKFIQNKSMDELKKMFTDFLNTQVTASQKTTSSKGKWGAFADRMSGLTTSEITEHIQKTSLEMRDGFQLRDAKR